MGYYNGVSAEKITDASLRKSDINKTLFSYYILYRNKNVHDQHSLLVNHASTEHDIFIVERGVYFYA